MLGAVSASTHEGRRAGGTAQRIGILVVAYNAASTLHTVLDRIPPDFRSRISDVLVRDDASTDATYLVGLGYQSQSDLPITLVRHSQNMGYGGNQKAGYRWCIEHDLDIVVLLHGDGQYAPELLPAMVAPLERGECDAVFGSRMLTEGAARRGGMPLYKYAGNRILTTVENALAGMDLSEWHSGYRAYSVEALADIPFETNSDGFDFDSEVIIQLHEAGKRIVEIPIPTYYGDEICHVNGLGYARDVVTDVARYRLHKMGFGTGELAFNSQDYELKEGETSSHSQLLSWFRGRPAGKVLDLGCADGSLASLVRQAGHEVVGVDTHKSDAVLSRVDTFIEADLDRPLPAEVDDDFDVVLCADVLEHLRQPEQLLAEARERLAPGGVVMVSVPNFGHWYPRARVLVGRFDYDRRGILDADHVRFFTRASFERLVARSGFRVRRRSITGIPFEVTKRGADGGDSAPTAADGASSRGLVARVDSALAKAWPTLFGYQLLYELEPVEGAPAH